MMVEDDPLFSRAAAAIAESQTLATEHQLLLQEMAAIYEQRMLSAMRAANHLKLSEQQLIERYRRLGGDVF
ncbi:MULTISPECIES: hypothetical protein [unclassified Bradyrhizobium]|uniref:hypothetical protein n=1 Tax=unclassified Bradyrhizobium TaxID=2631580 RepID=UPI0020B41F03|nr:MULTISPECIES: hypothetical protein [unclassified Bradyrhizobium]MCP3401706.1 hypothetical protein [Bradyrhizobium sp. CCGB20]MCP3410211.1 hypothetical protein [Bradyrhizobium sp. CCGB01]